MKLTTLALLAAPMLAFIMSGTANAEPNRVTFPANYDEFVHYSTFQRSEEERMMTTRDAIAAAQRGEPMPDGTHVIIEFRNDADEVTRFFVMEKGAGWGADFPDAQRTGDWQFQEFLADRSVNTTANTARCMSCHQGRADDDYQFMYDDLLGFQAP